MDNFVKFLQQWWIYIFCEFLLCKVNSFVFFNVPEDWAEIFWQKQLRTDAEVQAIGHLWEFYIHNPFFFFLNIWIILLHFFFLARVEVGVFDRYEKWDMKCNKCVVILYRKERQSERREHNLHDCSFFGDHRRRLHIILVEDRILFFVCGNVLKVRFGFGAIRNG